MTVAERLKEERERLGFSQPRWGELAKVVKQTVIQWEKGASAPDAPQLSALAAVGADVLYIVTGVRSATAPVLGVEQQQAGYSVEVLDKQEQALLDNFRHCPQEGKQQLESASALYAKLSKKRA